VIPISKGNFAEIQRAIRLLVGVVPEEGYNPGLVDTYWAKGAAIMIC
jgi:hypothetical protein